MRRAIELHDSDLLSVTTTATGVSVKIDSYVHHEPDQIGSPGTGWCQEVELQFANGVIEELSADYPWWIMDGGVTGSVIRDNVIPLPCEIDSDVCFQAAGVNERSLMIRGTHLRIVPTGESRYVEDTPADLYPLYPDE